MNKYRTHSCAELNEKDIDELSLTTGKSININLIKKVLNQ